MAAPQPELADNRAPMSDTTSPDRRALRSRDAIRSAFLHLVLERRYHAISVGLIIGAAGVARSTFYEHFRNKDEVLVDSLRGPLAPLADAIDPRADRVRLEGMLLHFAANRRLAPGILAGAVGRRTATVLASMVEQRLRGSGPLRAPVALVAGQVAALQLSAITAWLDDRVACDAPDLARSLAQASAAVVAAQRVA